MPFRGSLPFDAGWHRQEIAVDVLGGEGHDGWVAPVLDRGGDLGFIGESGEGLLHEGAGRGVVGDIGLIDRTQLVLIPDHHETAGSANRAAAPRVDQQVAWELSSVTARAAGP